MLRVSMDVTFCLTVELLNRAGTCRMQVTSGMSMVGVEIFRRFFRRDHDFKNFLSHLREFVESNCSDPQIQDQHVNARRRSADSI